MACRRFIFPFIARSLVPRIKIMANGGTAATAGRIFYARRMEDDHGIPTCSATAVAISGCVAISNGTTKVELMPDHYARLNDCRSISAPSNQP